MQLDNDLFLRVLRGEEVNRPPVWLMRQAGRILPQYRAVRESLNGFIDLVKNPKLVAEVTVQPVDELNVDAAILFSDILVIPEALGLPYEMIEKRGPYFPKTIAVKSDIEKLNKAETAAEQLAYVYEGIYETKNKLNNRTPLIGFCGSPFTILCYMIEGSGSKTFSKAKKFLYKESSLAHSLLQKITDASIAYLIKKVDAGVDAIQLFDSWAGVLDNQSYKLFAIPYLRQIVTEIERRVPVIVFSKGAWFSLSEIDSLGSTAIGIDWNTDAKFVRSIVGSKKVLQGNLDPCVLYADHDYIESKTLEMITSFGKNHIANLGHGVYPDTPLEGVKCFVNTVKNYTY